VQREVRPRPDLDPPALVIGQVQMQPVHAVHGQVVDEALDFMDLQEMPGHVEHHAAPVEARPVHYAGAGDAQRTRQRGRVLHHGRHELPQRLHAIEETGRRAAGDVHALPCDRHLVTFVAEVNARGIDVQHDGAFGCSRRRNDTRRRLARGANERRQVVRDARGLRISGRRNDDRGRVHRERVRRHHLDVQRHRYHGMHGRAG
jgi:hypothetical protein